MTHTGSMYLGVGRTQNAIEEEMQATCKDERVKRSQALGQTISRASKNGKWTFLSLGDEPIQRKDLS